MLQILRKRAQSTFIQIIVVIIALVFIFWGVGANLGGDRQAALVVNGEQITFQQYQQAYDRAFQMLSDQFGGNVPKGLAETFGIKQQVIMQLIQTELLRQGAQKMGLQVSAEEIRQIIEGMVQFQEDGAFNIERYKTVLAANRMAPTKFEDTMRFDRLSEVAVREISNFANVVSDFEILEVYRQQNEKVAVKYTKISPDQFVDKVTIDDKALMTWFETVKENYKTDPQAKLNYLTFTYDEVGRKIDIDSSKIEEYYRNNIEEFQVPEQRHARHIILQATEEDSPEHHQEQARKAQEVLELAKKGQDFSALALEYSEDPSKDSGGDLGFFSEGQMVPSFDKVVFSMQPGKISEVVKTQFGYHIIMLEEIREEKTRPLDEVTAEIKTLLQRKEAENLAFQVANDAYEGIIRAGSLTKYAEENPDISIEQTDFISKTNAPADLKKDIQFLDKAFELNKGELSSLIKGQSGYAIFFVADIKEPQIPAFETIKDTLAEDYKKAESIKMADIAANDVLKELHDGKELESLAQKLNLTVLESGFLNRSEQNENTTFPSTLLEEVFLLSSSSPLPEKPGKVGNDLFVYTFLERKIPAMPEDNDVMETYRANLLRLKQQQLLTSWLRNQEIKAEITTHPNL